MVDIFFVYIFKFEYAERSVDTSVSNSRKTRIFSIIFSILISYTMVSNTEYLSLSRIHIQYLRVVKSDIV